MPDETYAAQTPSLPPLRIHHFFAWSVIAAGALTINSLATRGGQSPMNEPGGYRVVGITTGSAALVALAVVLMRGFAAVRRDWQPGHGLLALLSLAFVYGELVRLVLTLASGMPSWYEAVTWAYYLLFLATGVASALAARRPRAWFWFFVLWSASPIFWAVALRLILSLVSQNQVQLAALAIALLPYAPCGLLLSAAMVRERREGVTRHWTHWCGVLLWWSTFLVYLTLVAYATMAA